MTESRMKRKIHHDTTWTTKWVVKVLCPSLQLRPEQREYEIQANKIKLLSVYNRIFYEIIKVEGSNEEEEEHQRERERKISERFISRFNATNGYIKGNR